jgi:hypothetical protein
MNVPVEFIVLAITGWVGVLTWIFKSKASSYDQHLRECGERRVADGKTDATVEQRLNPSSGIPTRPRRLSAGWGTA